MRFPSRLLVAGAFVGAGFYRWQGGGLLTIPVGVGPVVLAQSAVGTEIHPPLFSFLDGRLALELPRSLPVAIGIGLAVFGVGLAVTWAIIRDVPLRDRVP